MIQKYFNFLKINSLKRIKDKMMISILPSVSILLVILIITIGIYIYNQEQDNTINRNLLTARSYASEINSFINKYNSIAETLTDSQNQYIAHSRTEVTDFLFKITEKDNQILGSWIIYEPNSFDYNDLANINKFGSDSKGRFAPYWNRLKSKLILESVMDIDSSEFYTIPKSSKKVHITSPFIYDNVLMMSFCYPILKNNIFKGVGGVDISIETVKSLLKNFDVKKTYKSNYAILVTSSGQLVSASNSSFEKYILNNKNLVQLFPELHYEQLTKEIDERKEGFLRLKDPFTKEKVVFFYSPIKSGNLSIIISISESDLLSNTLKAIYILTGIGILSIIIIGVIVYFLINTIIDPLNKLTDAVTKFGKHDFAQRSSVITNDEIGELAKNFNSMADSIEEYSSHMEEKVKVRTEELNLSLTEITNLNYQQNGDYFLTSILLRPFYKKVVDSEKYNIDFLIEQKKSFNFKGKKQSIGGDLCYVESIKLNGKKYLLVLNGDAMGKSIQGAGGALILGSVFGSLIERTKSSEVLQNVSPEKWLKNSFIELHKTFETFDGLMLVSVFLGLIDESSNVLFFINAEHPFTVLYRDGCASFIEDSFALRKLGTPLMDGKLYIKVFKLKPMDIILIGSDGKDDLVLENKSEAIRIINEDEKLFLRVVEESDAELHAIRENLLKKGEFLDDLSLVRIEYLGNNELEEIQIPKKIVSSRIEAIQFLELESIKNPMLLKRLSKYYFLEKNYSKAYLSIKKFIEHDPSDIDSLFIASYCGMKLDLLNESIEFGERCVMRAPAVIKYRELLSKVYTKSGNHSKAKSILIIKIE